MDKVLHIMAQVIQYAADKSPDPNTQNAAFLVAPDNTILTKKANQFPLGILSTKERWKRPLKYYYVEHAERNAIYQAARLGIQTDGTILYCPWFACADCARAIIQAGIVEVIGLDGIKVYSPKLRAALAFYKEITPKSRWTETTRIGGEMLDEAGVIRTYIKFPAKLGIVLRRDGKEVLL